MSKAATTSGVPSFLGGLSEVAAQYDGFILDLWGVVHDGVNPFPDTIPTLRELRRAKRKVWMLSNAPRRAQLVVDRLTAMGVTPDLYDGVVTSGEATWMSLRDRYLSEFGRRIFFIGPPRDSNLYEGLGAEIVRDPAAADFVLCCGIDDFSDGLEKYLTMLDACAAQNLPMICANPDRVVHVGDQLVLCAGSLADAYEERGGAVTYFGKPHKLVYRLCREGMGTGNVMAVGDAMITDIAGATGAGLDSALVLSGIHREDFGEHDPETLTENQVRGFLESFPYRPNYLLPRLFW